MCYYPKLAKACVITFENILPPSLPIPEGWNLRERGIDLRGVDGVDLLRKLGPEYCEATGIPAYPEEHIAAFGNNLKALIKDMKNPATPKPSITILQHIGHGCFGSVNICAFRGYLCAVKITNESRVAGTSILQLARELMLPALPPHSNVLRCILCFRDGGLTYSIMEFCDSGDLARCMEAFRVRGRHIPIPDCVEVLLQAARGLRHIHKYNIAHRDFKAANILLCRRNIPEVTLSKETIAHPLEHPYQHTYPVPGVTAPIGDFRVVLGDFGLARYIPDRSPSSRPGSGGGSSSSGRQRRLSCGVGTELYAAPEVRKDNYDCKIDIYGFGVVAAELFSGRPAQDFMPLRRHDAVISAESAVQRALPHWVPQSILRLLLKCVADKPENRPSASELVTMLKRIQKEVGPCSCSHK